MTQVTITNNFPNSKTVFTPALYPKKSYFVMYSELFQVLGWKDNVASVYDFEGGKVFELDPDNHFAFYQPVSKVDITFS